MAFSGATFGDIGGAVSDIFGAVGAGASAKAYKTAAGIDLQNAQLAKESAAIQEVQTQRQVLLTTGAQQAQVGGAGFASSGSSLDLLRSSQQQGALATSLIKTQGAINVNNFEEQAAANTGMANAAKAKSTGGFLSGILQIGAAAATIFSDARLKYDITYMYTRMDKVPVYRFKYLGSEHVWEGTIAQEVAKVRPDAVHLDRTGFFKVDYAALELPLKLIAGEAVYA